MFVGSNYTGQNSYGFIKKTINGGSNMDRYIQTPGTIEFINSSFLYR